MIICPTFYSSLGYADENDSECIIIFVVYESDRNRKMPGSLINNLLEFVFGFFLFFFNKGNIIIMMKF